MKLWREKENNIDTQRCFYKRIREVNKKLFIAWRQPVDEVAVHLWEIPDFATV